MALLTKKSFNRIKKERNTVHRPVDATYTSFFEGDTKYFQIDTYGSFDRKIPGKVSQSIQLDKGMALELIKLLSKEYDLEVLVKLA